MGSLIIAQLADGTKVKTSGWWDSRWVPIPGELVSLHRDDQGDLIIDVGLPWHLLGLKPREPRGLLYRWPRRLILADAAERAWRYYLKHSQRADRIDQINQKTTGGPGVKGEFRCAWVWTCPACAERPPRPGDVVWVGSTCSRCRESTSDWRTGLFQLAAVYVDADKADKLHHGARVRIAGFVDPECA